MAGASRARDRSGVRHCGRRGAGLCGASDQRIRARRIFPRGEDRERRCRFAGACGDAARIRRKPLSQIGAACRHRCRQPGGGIDVGGEWDCVADSARRRSVPGGRCYAKPDRPARRGRAHRAARPSTIHPFFYPRPRWRKPTNGSATEITFSTAGTKHRLYHRRDAARHCRGPKRRGHRHRRGAMAFRHAGPAAARRSEAR